MRFAEWVAVTVWLVVKAGWDAVTSDPFDAEIVRQREHLRDLARRAGLSMIWIWMTGFTVES